MRAAESPLLPEYLADNLSDRAQVLGTLWLEGVAERLQLPPDRVLPSADLLDHLPDLIVWVSEFIRSPAAVPRPEFRERLVLLARHRREQGFSMQETLREIEDLSRFIWDEYVRLSEQYSGTADPGTLARCGGRLRRALGLVISTIVVVWEEADANQRTRLAGRLAEFARMVVHELKNPLNAIHLWSELLRSGAQTVGPDRIASYADSIQHATGRMSDLLDDIRVLAVAESAQADERWALLRTLIDEVFILLADSARARGVECRIAEPLPAIHVDAVQVQIALANLIGNAIKYSDPAKPSRWLEVRASRNDSAPHGWKIEVSDNGLGIPADLQHKLFARHFRAHPEVADGTGLGLAITQHVVEQRYGSVGFRSQEGHGSTFFLVVSDRDESMQDSGDDGGDEATSPDARESPPLHA